MRTTTILLMLLAAAFPQVAFALRASDTMSDWAGASEQERSAILDEVLAKIGKPSVVSRLEVLDCLNRAAAVGSHGSLLIAEMAQACAAPPQPDDSGSAKSAI